MHLLNIFRKLIFFRNYSWKLLLVGSFLKLFSYHSFSIWLDPIRIDKNLTLSSPIINCIQTVMNFLTSCVPYCKFISFLCLTIRTSRVIYFYFLFKESCIEGWNLSFIKFSFTKSYRNWCFTDTSFMFWVNILIIYLHSPRTTILKVSTPFSILI